MNIMANMGITKKKQMEVKQIPAALLVENPDNFYLVGDVSDLKESIITDGGVLQNLVVEPMDDGRYLIISGHRRAKAVKELLKEGAVGISDTLPCLISRDKGQNNRSLIDLNATTRKLTAWEEVEQYNRKRSLVEYQKKAGKLNKRMRDALADALGKAPTQIAYFSAITNNLKRYFYDWMKTEKLGISAAYELSKLSDEQQKNFYEAYKDAQRISIHDVKAFATPETPTEQMPVIETPAAALEEPKPVVEEPRATETAKEPEEKKKIDPKHFFDGTEEDGPEEAEDIEEVPEEAGKAEASTKDKPITWEEYMELRKEYKKVMRNIMDKHRLIDDYVELEKNGTYTQIQMIHNMQWATSAMYKQLDYLMELVDKMKVVRGHAEK
ncbi:ParB/RepB/Spo0J family partition protein [Megasphaera sp.]|uniref:ParB/RepB/Spo0J family partition protein n=1 Tax=Megasphaera sp. TaxID=2023260 RepID=UPI003521A732